MNKHRWCAMLPLRLGVLLFGSVACEPADFQVVSLDITPQEVVPREEVTITASNPCQIG